MQQLLDLPRDRLAIVPVLSQKSRHELHSFLETFHPKLRKQSLRSRKYDADRKGIYKRCCGGLVPMTYRSGVLENNKDEYYSGFCRKCENCVYWDCNYDDDNNVVIFHHNNIIVVGAYLNTFQAHGTTTLECSLERAESILAEYPPIIIDNPPLQLSSRGNLQYLCRNELQEYIDSKLV